MNYELRINLYLCAETNAFTTYQTINLYSLWTKLNLM
jgi:hypothetical protein